MNNANRMLNQNINNNPNYMQNPNMNQLTYNTIGNNMQNSEEKFSRELKLGNEIYIIKVKKIKPSQILIICENKFDYLSLYGYSITLTYEEFCKLGRSFRLYDNIDEIYDTIKNLFKGVDFSFKNEFNMGQNSMMQMNYNQGQQGMMGMNNPGMQGMMGSMNNMANNNMNLMSNNQIQSNINMSNNALNSKDSSNVKLENSNNGSINLILKIPLLNEKYEKIKIEFKKENKDIRKQYEKLKNKFLKIKKIVYPDLEEKKNQNNQMNNNPNMPSIIPMNQAGMGLNQIRTSDSILSQIKNEFEN